VPAAPGPEHVPDDPPFGALQFTSVVVESVLQDLDVNKGFGPVGIPPIILISFLRIFSKDCVRHKLLLNEMSVSIESARCKWLGSYLSGRIQKIRIGDAVSNGIKVTSHVSQGSHLGSLCFIWFVNRVSEIFDYVIVLFYADDMKLFLPVSGFQDCLKIQSDLNKL
jgi:hypothetical protein